MIGIKASDRQITKRKWAALIAALFVCILVIITVFYYQNMAIPEWAEWKEKETTVVTEEAEFRISLSGRSIDVMSLNNDLIWTSENGWFVSDFLAGDIDRDGKTEVLLLVWKRGSYGKHRPFWVSSDICRFTQHIFIYDIVDTYGFKPAWMSSKLEIPVLDWSLDEKKLIHIRDTDSEESVWGWMSWGLTRVD